MPVPEDLTQSSDLYGHRMTQLPLHTCRQYTHTHKKNKNLERIKGGITINIVKKLKPYTYYQ